MVMDDRGKITTQQWQKIKNLLLDQDEEWDDGRSKAIQSLTRISASKYIDILLKKKKKLC